MSHSCIEASPAPPDNVTDVNDVNDVNSEELAPPLASDGLKGADTVVVALSAAAAGIIVCVEEVVQKVSLPSVFLEFGDGGAGCNGKVEKEEEEEEEEVEEEEEEEAEEEEEEEDMGIEKRQ